MAYNVDAVWVTKMAEELLKYISNQNGTICLEHDWKGDSFDHFGFCLEEVCENCGEKRQTGC